MNGSDDSLSRNVIHQLAIEETLEEQPDDQAPIFFLFERECEQSRQQIKCKEKCVEDKDGGESSGYRIERMLEALHHDPEERHDRGQVHQR